MRGGPQPAPELANVPTDELPELVDMLVWGGRGLKRERVSAWHAELLARADRDDPPVRLAADVCLEYLAGPNSRFGIRIGDRVASGLDGRGNRPSLVQDHSHYPGGHSERPGGFAEPVDDVSFLQATRTVSLGLALTGVVFALGATLGRAHAGRTRLSPETRP